MFTNKQNNAHKDIASLVMAVDDFDIEDTNSYWTTTDMETFESTLPIQAHHSQTTQSYPSDNNNSSPPYLKQSFSLTNNNSAPKYERTLSPRSIYQIIDKPNAIVMLSPRNSNSNHHVARQPSYLNICDDVSDSDEEESTSSSFAENELESISMIAEESKRMNANRTDYDFYEYSFHPEQQQYIANMTLNVKHFAQDTESVTVAEYKSSSIDNLTILSEDQEFMDKCDLQLKDVIFSITNPQNVGKDAVKIRDVLLLTHPIFVDDPCDILSLLERRTSLLSATYKFVHVQDCLQRLFGKR